MRAALPQQNSGIAPASRSAPGFARKEQHHADQLQAAGQGGPGFGLRECHAQRPDQRRPGRRRLGLTADQQHLLTTSARRDFGSAAMWPRADRYALTVLTLKFTGAVAFIAIVCATVWSAT